MGLNEEQRKQLKELQRLEKEPDKPAPSVSFTLDLGSDTAWERAKSLGLVSDGDGDDGGDDDEEEEADDAPRRQGRGERFFGTGG